MIERITEEEERASEAIADLAGRNGISFKPLSPSSNDIRTLEHEGLLSNIRKKKSKAFWNQNRKFCQKCIKFRFLVAVMLVTIF